MKPRYYLDTSAYLAALLGEEGSEPLAATIVGSSMCSSVLLLVEANRNVVRLARTGQLTPARSAEALAVIREDASRFVLRDVTLDLCLEPAMPALRTPKSLDLVHLRTALWFHRREPLHGYLTNDSSQRDAARELGLPVA
jgi:hypothetical protein